MIFLLLVRKFQQDKTQRMKTHTHDMKEVAHRLIQTAQEIKKCDLKKITLHFYEISLIK
jgi:Cu/Ag efflux protein CusF